MKRPSGPINGPTSPSPQTEPALPLAIVDNNGGVFIIREEQRAMQNQPELTQEIPSPGIKRRDYQQPKSSTSGAAQKSEPNVKVGQANYILGLVTFCYCMAYVDRQLLNLLIEPIKRGMAISDTQFSLVQGTAFVVSYIAAAPIFGRLVDVASRRLILIFGVCAWSFFTTLSGFCETYTQLFLARMGVGLTEACVFPVAWSLIGDCFSAKRQPKALSVFMLGPQLGGGFSLIAGGLIIAFAATLTSVIGFLNGREAWQTAFILTGLPGMLFAMVLFTIKEPRRTGSVLPNTNVKLKFGQVLSSIWANKSFYGRMFLGTGMVGICQLAIPSWFPAFMIRTHELSASETGLKLGMISATLGPISTLSGPIVSDWLHSRGYVDAPLRVAAACAIPALGFAFMIPMVTSPTAALVCAAGIIFSFGFPVGLMAAATQLATPAGMRGVVASIYTFASQVLGFMIGPTLVALLTDKVFHDVNMVGHSMQIVMCGAAATAGICFFTARKHFRQILARADG
jgi:MFS family permease